MAPDIDFTMTSYPITSKRHALRPDWYYINEWLYHFDREIARWQDDGGATYSSPFIPLPY